MQGAMPGPVFWGPFAQPGRRNLLDVALAATAAADEFYAPDQSIDPRWVDGFSFSSDSCDALDPMGIQCLGNPGGDKDHVENPDVVVIDPFLASGTDVCSTLDNKRDREGRARRNLLATESWQIEREFFDGAASLTTTPQGRSPFMTDGVTAQDITGGAAKAATLALATLERELLDCLHGQRAIIHATPDLVTMWQSGGALHIEGTTIMTVTDTIIVPGAGYSGAGPDGTPAAAGTSWAYGTGLVYLRQANIFDPDIETPYARVDRARNVTTWRVERANAIYFAPCCVKAVHASLT